MVKKKKVMEHLTGLFGTPCIPKYSTTIYTKRLTSFIIRVYGPEIRPFSSTNEQKKITI